MSTSDQNEASAEGSSRQQQSAWEHMLSAEGYRAFTTRHSLQLTPLSAEQRLFELLVTIGHEFSTPLTIIDGYTTTLLRRSQQIAPQEHDEFLTIIQRAGLHMQYLLARLFEVAELEAGSVSIDWNLIDIPSLARESITVAQRSVPASLHDRFTFHLQCRGDDGNQTEQVPFLNGDERCVRKILGHLLENAVRYSPEGGRIDVIVRPAPQAEVGDDSEQSRQAPAFLEICVCDFGLGIAGEHQERIFEHFYRVDTRLTREVYGLGLGLTVCKYLVELHQGRIWVESCPDGGSAFHVWLPLAGPLAMH